MRRWRSVSRALTPLSCVAERVAVIVANIHSSPIHGFWYIAGCGNGRAMHKSCEGLTNESTLQAHAVLHRITEYSLVSTLMSLRLSAARTPATKVPSDRTTCQENPRTLFHSFACTTHCSISVRTSLCFCFLCLKLVFFINPSLHPPQYRPSYASLPFLDEALLALCSLLSFSALRCRAVRECCRLYLPATGHEPQVWPTCDPEKCEVEDPPQP